LLFALERHASKEVPSGRGATTTGRSSLLAGKVPLLIVLVCRRAPRPTQAASEEALEAAEETLLAALLALDVALDPAEERLLEEVLCIALDALDWAERLLEPLLCWALLAAALCRASPPPPQAVRIATTEARPATRKYIESGIKTPLTI
jgi:hypothetical protein